jgi:DNA-directed RNA polymerase specialized sigma24 family protein
VDVSDLIQKSCGGERAIFNKLVVECQAGVYNYVRHRGPGDPITAEDGNEKLVVKALRKICTLKHDSFIAWVYTIVRGMCTNEWLARIKIDYVT